MRAMQALLIGGLMVLAAAMVFTVAAGAQEGFKVTVDRLVDGDTFEVAEGWCIPWVACREKIRVFGIDTPESRAGGGLAGAKCVKELKLGKIAKQWARETLEGKTVTIFPLPKVDQKKEPRGRLLASVTLPDGKDYASEAIRLGHARKYIIVNGDYQKSNWCK
jgi:endonuclease YncB( thermonuclease family)